ncbi:hypothetical protein BASA81_010007 [Batrachochytrium salamandrivorans]|nr:hypothetical protein BASA81_010007 [Batrachochytrium salamandrivorans]
MKVLVSGLVETEAQWQVLLDRVNQLHASKHGPFDALLVLPGSVMCPLEFPLPVVAQSGKVAGGELSVQMVSKLAPTPISACDVLMSEFLPGNNSGVPNPIKSCPEAEVWALATRPRYHFAGGAHGFFQRAPYRNPGPHRKQVTRLVVLCPVGSKEKWIHALNIPVLDANAPSPEPAGTTDCPYSLAKPSSTTAATAPARQQFFFAAPAVEAALEANKRPRTTTNNSRQQPQQQRPQARLDCWFCLASINCEKHLIVHVEEECYLALPRGGIQLEHVLLVPVSHQANLAQFLQTNQQEVLKLVLRVQRMFARQGFGVLITDRSLVYGKAAQQHAYLELLPVPLDKLPVAVERFEQQAKELGIAFTPTTTTGVAEQLAHLSRETGEYLFVSLPSGQAFIHHKAEGEDMDDAQIRAGKLQFGRQLTIGLCDLPKEHIHWKACVRPKMDEAVLAKQFTKLWKEVEE